MKTIKRHFKYKGYDIYKKEEDGLFYVLSKLFPYKAYTRTKRLTDAYQFIENKLITDERGPVSRVKELLRMKKQELEEMRKKRFFEAFNKEYFEKLFRKKMTNEQFEVFKEELFDDVRYLIDHKAKSHFAELREVWKDDK